MKVLLVNPPNRFWLWPPLGLAYVAAVLKRQGCQVTVLDMAATPEIPLELALQMKPDMVGLTCTSQTFQSALTIARQVKTHLQKCIVVFGGSHPSGMPAETLRHEEVDVVVKGEAENGILNVLNGQRGIVEGSQMNIDSIPLPARGLLPMNSYDYPGSILTSRGCPFRCNYCVHSVSGYGWRGRKPEDVLEEIMLLKNKYGLKDVYFVDDNFSLNMARAKTIMHLLIEENLGLSLWFHNGLRADHFDSELAWLMQVAGAKLVSFGLESVNSNVLTNMGKRVTVKQVEDAVKLAHDNGIKVRVSLMIGNVGDTFETVLETVEWVKNNQYLDFAEFSLCTAYPNTPLYSWVQKHGKLLVDPEDMPTYFMDKEATPSFETPDFPAEQRMKALRIAQRMVQRKFVFKNRSLRNFRIKRIPVYVSTVASLITGKPMKPKFRS